MLQNWTVQYWLGAGAPRCKLVLGTSFYGAAFTLKDASDPLVGAPTVDPAPSGPFTDQPGLYAYFEVS